MKRFQDYENETLETYYALGNANKFLKAFDTQEEELSFCKEPKDAYTFVRYDKAKQFLIEYSKMLEGFKIYSIHHKVKTETHYSVLDCEIYTGEQNGPMINSKNVPCGKFDNEGRRI